MWVCLGLFCIVFVCVCYIMCTHDAQCMCHVGIVSGVFSLLLYVDRKKKVYHIYFITTLPDSAFMDFALVCRVDVSFGILNVRVTLSAVGFL